jgi:hypothetical protein
VENYEALRRDIHFRKDSLGCKRVHLFLMELNTHSVTQGCDSKWLQGLNIHCKYQWIPNWTRKMTHMHTNTHTYAHPKCRYTIHYLVSKFLNFHLLNYNVEQPKSLNPKTPWCTPSIPTIWMRGFLSRILMHTHTSMHTQKHTHTHTHTQLS